MRGNMIGLLITAVAAAYGVTPAVPAAETNQTITADTTALTAGTFTAAEAAKRVGEKLTVTGRVASTFFMQDSERQPTFINLGKEYPNQDLTVVIFGEKRNLFGAPPEEAFKDKTISVTGEVLLYRDRPEIVVEDPKMIHVIESENDEQATAEDVRPRAPSQVSRVE